MGISDVDVNFGVIPVSHSYGFSNLLTPLIARGVAMVLSQDRTPRAVLNDLAKTDATVFPGMPVFYQAFCEMKDVPMLPKLRLCISAGAPLAITVPRKFGGWPAPRRLAVPSYALPERAAVPLSGRRGEARPFRLLGQYKATLILLEGPDGLYLIDQHVALERILYERLRRSLAAATPGSQALLTPQLLELGPAERLRLAELAPDLEACGFGITAPSGQTLALTAVPAVLSAREADVLLAALARESGGRAQAEEEGAARA